MELQKRSKAVTQTLREFSEIIKCSERGFICATRLEIYWTGNSVGGLGEDMWILSEENACRRNECVV